MAERLLSDVFLFGTLRHMPLLEIVLGEDVSERCVGARAEGYRIARAQDQVFPLLVEAENGAAQGVLLKNVDAQERARLDHYELGFGYALEPIETDRGPALVYVAREGAYAPAEGWSLTDWVENHWPYVRYAAQEMMALLGIVEAREMARWFKSINARAHARSEASGGGMAVEKVQLNARNLKHFGFFRTDELRLSHERFDGTRTPELSREVFLTGDAALVLPYDPVSDNVLIVEQFRLGPYARGDASPWVFEPVAGRVDPGEAPDVTARRECEEEAGVAPSRLMKIAEYYPSPGEVSAYFYCYLGIATLPEVGTWTGGLASEQEDIRSHVMPFAEAERLAAEGRLNVGPLLHMLLWLKGERAGLRS